MANALALCIASVFVALALWHLRMAFAMARGARNPAGSVPSVDGKPLFVPSVRATIAVGVALLMFAGLVVATAGLVPLGIAHEPLSWACFALALGLLARAVGEFRYVGFFKRVRGSRFAMLDTLVYSPLCLLLAIGVAAVAGESGF